MAEKIVRINIDDVCYLTNTPDYCLVPLNGGIPVDLSERAYIVLSFLLKFPNQDVSAEKIGHEIWGDVYGSYYDMSNLSPILSELRKKLEKVQTGFSKSHFISPKQSHYILINHAAQENLPLAQEKAQLNQIYSAKSGTSCAYFILQDWYITPDKALNHLLKTAFLTSPVLAISGARGQGKTELARCFTAACIRASNGRSDLKFKSVVATTYQPEGLRETIAALPCQIGCKNTMIVAEKLQLLRDLPKPSLLIIDNYNNETSCIEELSLQNADYCQLVETGVNILLTSQVNLEACDCVHQFMLEPLPLEQQHKLFVNLSGLSEEELDQQKENIQELTETCLNGNTYLICLAARLVKQSKTVGQILEAFREMKVQKLRGAVAQRKVGHDSIARNLMAQFLQMFDLSTIRDNPLRFQLLLNLALLPTEGIDCDTFLNWAFPDCDAVDQEVEHLRDGFWLFLTDHKIRIHPMIREMILRKTKEADFPDFRDFVKTINEKNRMERYCEEMPAYTGLAIAANQSLTMLNCFDTAQAFLVANIASNFDTMRFEELAYRYGEEALSRLDKLPSSSDPQQLYLSAYFYSVVGYAILHDKEHKDSASQAEHSLQRALELVQTAQEQNSEDLRLLKLECKIRGNLGALYQKRKNYEQALKMHEQSRDRRLELFAATKDPEFQKMLADSYRSIATDHFYLSRGCGEAQAKEHLMQSIENHEKNIDYWKNTEGEDNCDYCIGANRLIGTWITLLNVLKDRDKVRERVADLQEELHHTVVYLDTINPIPAELNTCLGNVLKLYTLQKEFEVMDPGFKKLLIDTDNAFRPKVFDYPKGWEENLTKLKNCLEEI